MFSVAAVAPYLITGSTLLWNKRVWKEEGQGYLVNYYNRFFGMNLLY